MGDTAEELTIGEVAERAGLATSAIRHYESLGLLTSTRNDSGHRRFNRSVLRRIAVIQAAQHVGLSLAEIRRAFAKFPADHAPTKQDWVRLSKTWRPLLDARIRELEQVRDGLSMCIGCGCLTMRQCAIYNPHDELAATGSGARRMFPEFHPPT
ncbi:redox-sensitive transcriptional activator SoxR [Enemella sp. A6]|uniref:redox-sensitive transcriptional activator SoxR n=1 Tax=Enemella sp. A6 TaxID=3440152 RepID=UPI003EC05362